MPMKLRGLSSKRLTLKQLSLQS